MFDSSIFWIPQFLAGLTSTIVAFCLWRRRSASGAKVLMILMIATAEWAFLSALHKASPDLSTKILLAKIQYIGIVTVPPALLVFILQYTGRERWLTGRNLILLVIFPVVTLALAWTNEVHSLIWKRIWLDISGSIPIGVYDYGPYFWIYISFAYLLVLLSTIWLIQAFISSPHFYRRQVLVMLIGISAPWLVNVLHIFKLSPLPHIDLTPIAFTFTGLAMGVGLFWFRIFDIVPVAHETVLKSIPDGVIVLDYHNRIIDMNPAAQMILGLPDSEVIGQSALQIFADQPILIEHLSDVTEVRSEITLGEGDTQHYFDLYISPFKDRQGSFTGRLITLRDFTQRKRGEEALKKTHDELRVSEARLRDPIEKNSDAILIVDREGIVRFANPAAGTLFGKSPEEFTGDPFGFPLTAGETTEIDLLCGNRGPTVAEMRVAEIEWEGEKAYLASLRDITERKRMEQELREANQKILEQQKAVIEEERLKVLLQMAGATAHEMNQPLMSLLGNIDLMRANGDNPEKLTRRLRDIETAGKRISGIVKKIQTIRHYDTKPYAGHTAIIDIDQEIKILIVSDSDDDFETVGGVLKDMDQISMTRTGTIAKALEMLGQGRIDLILLGYLLPDGNGLDFLRIMDEKGIETPVIVIADQGNEMIASRVIQAGASDYLTREMVSEKSLFRSIAGSLEKSRLKRDIRLAQERMAEMATRDELTRLFNRRYFMEALEREMARAKRYKTGLALCMMDLDHFKEINDTYGHSAGDMVLSEMGKLLKEHIRESDLVCRYGGEEFCLILIETNMEGARLLCEKLREAVAAHQFEYDSSRFQITVSAGIASLGKTGPKSSKELIDKADQALYRAKREGRNRVVGSDEC